MENNKETKKGKILPADLEAERARLLSQADEIKGEQISLNIDGELTKNLEFPIVLSGNIDDPDKRFDIYYKNINRILRKTLPKGKRYKEARDFIYEEKNVILTRGKRKKPDGTRGADGRMAYISDAEEVLSMVAKWANENGKMTDLFNELHSYNINKGYGKRF